MLLVWWCKWHLACKTHSHTTVLWNLSGTTRVSRYQKKHSPTHTHRSHQSSQSAFSIYYDPWHPPYSIHVLYSLFPNLSKFSLVYLLAWYPPLHTPYISSPNHCLLFAAHAHTIATCSAVVLRLCPLLQSPSPLFTWNSILHLACKMLPFIFSVSPPIPVSLEKKIS